MKTIFASLIALAALGALAAPAAAAPAGEAFHLVQRVSYADLDLSKEADAQRLLNRLRRAAADVCESGDISLARQAQSRACRQSAMAMAVAELQAPLVAQAYYGATAG
jgi:UrcA family protein